MKVIFQSFCSAFVLFSLIPLSKSEKKDAAIDSLSEVPSGEELSQKIAKEVKRMSEQLPEKEADEAKKKLQQKIQKYLEDVKELTEFPKSPSPSTSTPKKSEIDEKLKKLLGTSFSAEEKESTTAVKKKLKRAAKKAAKKAKAKQQKAPTDDDDEEEVIATTQKATKEKDDEEDEESANTATKFTPKNKKPNQDLKQLTEVLDDEDFPTQIPTKEALIESLPTLKRDLRQKMISKNQTCGKCLVGRFIWYLQQFLQEIATPTTENGQLEGLNSIIEDSKSAETTHDILAACKRVKKLFRKTFHKPITPQPSADLSQCKCTRAEDIESICKQLKDDSTNKDAFGEYTESFNSKIAKLCDKVQDTDLKREFQMKELVSYLNKREKAIEQQKMIKNAEMDESCDAGGGSGGDDKACPLKEKLKELKQKILETKKDIEKTEMTRVFNAKMESFQLRLCTLITKEDIEAFKQSLEAFKEKIKSFDVESSKRE